MRILSRKVVFFPFSLPLFDIPRVGKQFIPDADAANITIRLFKRPIFVDPQEAMMFMCC
jgi:hypothetical protein